MVPMMNMDCVEIEEIIDVPDTPDRLLARNKNGYANKMDAKSSKNHDSVSNGDFDARYRIPPRDKNKTISDNGSRGLFNYPREFSNSISMLGNPFSSSKCKNIVVENSEEKEKGKGKALLNSNPKWPTCQSNGRFVDLTERNSPARSYKDRFVLGDRLLGRAEDPVKLADNSCKLNVEFVKKCIGSSNSDRGKGIADTVDSRSTTSPRLTGQKRLVRNGCISPSNIAKIKQSTEKHDDSTSAHAAQNNTNIVASDASPSTVDIRELIAEARNSKRFKGKEVSHSLFSSNESDTQTVHQSQSDTIGATSSCFEGLDGWRTTRNHSKKVDLSVPDHQNFPRRNSDSYVDDQQHKNIRTGNALHKRQRPAQTLTSPRECSMSSFVDSDLRPPAETSSMRLGRECSFHAVDSGDSIIDLDFSPDMRTNRDSTVRKRQEEADELLARELQEQLYNEVPEVGVDEIDEHMAFTLQEEETSLPHPRRRRHRLLRPSHSSLLDIIELSRHLPPGPAARRGARAQTSTSTRGTRGRNRFPGRPRTLWTSTTSVFPEDMNLDMRMHILEQAEAFTDMDTLDRDFNENDYEMLLALDENNHRHSGASRAQINGLPQSKVQSENLEDCAICLDTPTIGQTIRHLPCLHSFHKACIDPWLKRKSSCPVCKSSVT